MARRCRSPLTRSKNWTAARCGSSRRIRLRSAPDRQHAGQVRIGAIGPDLVESPRQFGEANTLCDDQPVNPDCVWSHNDLHIAPSDVSESRAERLSRRPRGRQNAERMDAQRSSTIAANRPSLPPKKRIHCGLGSSGALDNEVDGGSTVAVLQKDLDSGIQNLGTANFAARSVPPHWSDCRHWHPCFSLNVTYITLSMEATMSSRRLVSGSWLLPPLTDPTEFATYRAQAEATRRDDLYPLLRSPRPRSLSAGSADRQPETLQISCPPPSARKTLRPEVGAIEAETTSKRRARPRLFHALRHAPQDVAAQILIEAEKLLRIHGHQKLRVADVA